MLDSSFSSSILASKCSSDCGHTVLRYLVGDTLVLHVVGEGGAGGDVDHEAATAAHRQALPGLEETTAQQHALQIDLN